MSELDNSILFLLESGYETRIILKELNIDEITLADIIIDLESKELITLEGKNWTLTEKGRDVLKEIKGELLKKLKIDHLYGNIDKDEFRKKINELESIVTIGKQQTDENMKGEKEKKISCPKCGIDNKIEGKYCRKCGESLKN